MDDELKVFMQLHGTIHFLQDRAHCHKSNIVMEWFNNRPNMKLIKWQGISPDQPHRKCAGMDEVTPERHQL